MFSLQDMLPIQNQVEASVTIVGIVKAKAATSIGAIEMVEKCM